MTMVHAAHYRRFLPLAALALLWTGCVLPVDTEQPPPAEGNNAPGSIQQSLANEAPVADAGEDQTVHTGENVRLDGTGSSDPDGDQLRFVWIQISGTPVIDIGPGSTSIVSFDAPEDITEATTLTFSLTVTDGFAASVDQVEVTLTPAD